MFNALIYFQEDGKGMLSVGYLEAAIEIKSEGGIVDWLNRQQFASSQNVYVSPTLMIDKGSRENCIAISCVI